MSSSFLLYIVDKLHREMKFVYNLQTNELGLWFENKRKVILHGPKRRDKC